jgi:hypothetical protein
MNVVYYPIIDAVDSVRIDADEDQPVVGVLAFILYRKTHMCALKFRDSQRSLGEAALIHYIQY